MKRDSDDLTAPQLVGHIARRLIQRRLGHAVRPPTAEPVVADRAHSSGEVAYDRTTCEQVLQRLRDEHWADGIDL